MHLNACIELDQKTLGGIWSKPQWQRELTDPKRICIGIINSKNNELLGLCSAWIVIDELHITLLAVNPIHQRKGIGRFLLADLMKNSNSIRTKQIYLEVKETNEPAKAFYKSLGFKIVSRRSNFYKDGSNALIFIKKLT